MQLGPQLLATSTLNLPRCGLTLQQLFKTRAGVTHHAWASTLNLSRCGLTLQQLFKTRAGVTHHAWAHVGAHSWARRLVCPVGGLFGANSGKAEASRPASKRAVWDYWETAVLGQILAGSRLEPDFAICGLPGRQLNAPSGIIGKRSVWGQILAGSLLEPDFGNSEASRMALKSACWDYWETANFPPNPGQGAFWSQILTIWRLLGRN